MIVERTVGRRVGVGVGVLIRVGRRVRVGVVVGVCVRVGRRVRVAVGLTTGVGVADGGAGRVGSSVTG